MRMNYETCIVGEKCVLVPYRPEHVERYHEWMKDPHLLEATGSEPLSLQEEIAMQQSWRDDPDKCTFIVLSRDRCCDENIDSDFACRNLHAMVGDVNLFLSQDEDDDDDDEDEGTYDKRQQQAELDIMIAEKAYQRQGIGREASCLMMIYGAKYLGIRRYFCKINEDNNGSRALFERLGFQQCHYAECFRQVELEQKRSTPQEIEQAITDLYGGTMTTFNCPQRKKS